VRDVVWAPPGRTSDTVGEFFDLLGARCAQITHVSADGADFIEAIVAHRCPNAVRVADPFYADVLVMPMSAGKLCSGWAFVLVRSA